MKLSTTLSNQALVHIVYADLSTRYLNLDVAKYYIH